jgi:hypothetical protein
MTDSKCQILDFSKLPWSEAILVTPRNSVCAGWNRVMLWKHYNQTSNLLYIVEAEDVVGDTRQPLNMEQK